MRSIPNSRSLDFIPLDAPLLDIEWQADEYVLAELLAHVKNLWTRLGREKPHWSVLSADEFLPQQIPQRAPEFFASGARDAAELLGCLSRHRFAPAQFSRMFEFGCGLARVTPHLARTFNHVTAWDVSASHLEIAQNIAAAAA